MQKLRYLDTPYMTAIQIFFWRRCVYFFNFSGVLLGYEAVIFWHFSVIYNVSFTKIILISMPNRWAGGAMVLGQIPVPGRLTIWITVGQGPAAHAVGAGGCFTLICPFSPLSPSLWEMVRYRLKYCLKAVKPQNNQPTNQCPID